MYTGFSKSGTSRFGCVFVLVLTALQAVSLAEGGYKPAKTRLMTRWGSQVCPERVHVSYPRPQLVRSQWLNLNGLWDYAVCGRNESEPGEFEGEILVPFAIESALSGVGRQVGAENVLWYRRRFVLPADWGGRRVLLHFGAVDWEARVWVNGLKLGSHRGGYDAFTFDVTAALNDSGTQEVVLAVWDPTDAGCQPRGKQVQKPQGIWYTPVTGIWQTVWAEPVNDVHIKSLEIVPDIDNARVFVTVEGSSAACGCAVEAEVKVKGVTAARGEGSVAERMEIAIAEPRLWSPESPYLYDLEVTLKDSAGRRADKVESYFGMRKISLGKDDKAVTRLFLNNEPLFMFGPLDQGYWPDGLYTAPSDEALRYDIEITRKLGCNMARKHVKVEPARWYYWCDRLGLMVWQDIPSGDRYIRPDEGDFVRNAQSARQFERELCQVVGELRNHPSVIMWVAFNEGWGQYDTERITDLIKRCDPTRLVDSASGWVERGSGDVHDIHSYPGPAAPANEAGRAAVLGEFGGLGFPILEHSWQGQENWGYRQFASRSELTAAYSQLLGDLHLLVGGGLSAGVYTQTTDVETEVNGLMTYDRAMVKMDVERVRAMNHKLYLEPPVMKMVVASSQQKGQVWRYTTSAPAAGWQEQGFDDSQWQEGCGGFGTEATPGAVVRSVWSGSEIWLRRSFELKRIPQTVSLLIHHDEDADVHINGRLIADLAGFTTSYTRIALDEKSCEALQKGRNTLAVHCRQSGGGQYIDVGLVEVIEPEGR